jgi:VanZ family protein
LNATLRLTASVAVATLIAWMALIPDQPTILWIDKLDHLAAFGALAVALRMATGSGRLIVVLCTMAASAVEIAQGLFPSLRREPSMADLAAGVVGAVLAVVAMRIAQRTLRTRSASSGQRPAALAALSDASR